MSVLDFNKLDGIALSEDNKVLKLFLSDHLDWEKEYEHLIALQNKINSYIEFCEDKQYTDIYPDSQVERIVFEIHFQYNPTAKAEQFLKQVQAQLDEIGIMIESVIADYESDNASILNSASDTAPAKPKTRLWQKLFGRK